MSGGKPTAAWARQYIDRLGFALVPIPVGTKGPRDDGWNRPRSADNPTGYITDPLEAERHWTAHPEHGIGVVLGPSGIVSLDVDDVECARIALGEFGIDLDALRQVATTCIGNPKRFRLLFRAPEGVELTKHVLRWPGPEDGPRGANGKPKPVTVFELRAGAVQDVAPPTIHPDTGLPYRWDRSPRDLSPLPADLLAIWREWSAFQRDASALCPWAPSAANDNPQPPRQAPAPSGGGESVIDAWNRAHDVTRFLEARGYKRRGNRWLAPTSSSGLPGVQIKDGKALSFHASDPLNNDHWNDCFDVFRILDHGGDHNAAIAAAREALDMPARPRRRPDLRVVQPDQTETEGTAAVAPDPSAWRSPGNPFFGIGDDVLAYLDCNDKGVPRPNLYNVTEVLKRHTAWSGVLAWDEFGHRTVADAPPPWDHTQADEWHRREWQPADDLAAARWVQAAGINASVQTVQQAVESAAYDRTVHPVREFLDELTWDGTPRLSSWLSEYCDAPATSEYVAEVGLRWMISAVARIFRPGCQADSALILEGDQGVGKSSAFRILGGEWYTDDLPHVGQGKDASQAAQGAWLVEIAELDAIGRSEAAAVKAYLSRQTDRYRPPYGRRFVEVPRQCVFGGTVNPDGNGYLRDTTGNRRFWPVTVGRVDLDALAADRDQLWAEAVHRFRAGEPWWITDGRLAADARAEQDARRSGDEWESVARKYLTHEPSWSNGRRSWSARPRALREVTVQQVLEDALDIPSGRWSRQDQMRVAAALSAIGLRGEKRHRGRAYVVPTTMYEALDAEAVQALLKGGSEI